jgi:N-acetylglucosamine repressor
MAGQSIVELRKNYKQNQILNIIRYQKDVSRFSVKKQSQYSMSTVLNIINDLLKKKLIFEEECEDSRVGRKPKWLRIDADGGYFIGVEFNAENIYCVILDFSVSIIFSQMDSITDNDDVSSTIGKVKSLIRKAINYLGGRANKIFGIGIGAPGYVDVQKGIIIYYTLLKNWSNIPIKDLIEKEFKIKVYIENNVNAMALSYKWLWYEGDSKDFIFVSIRAGLRMSCILNNKLFPGDRGTAGEIGHIRASGNNRSCQCGKNGCLDTVVSNTGIRNRLVDEIKNGRFKQLFDMVGQDPERVNVYSFVDSVKAGHKDSVELVQDIAKSLGEVLANVINILNPDMVVLSGVLTKTGDIFVTKVKNTIYDNAIFVNCQNLKVRCSSFDENIGAVGAAALVMQKEFEVMEQMV